MAVNNTLYQYVKTADIGSYTQAQIELAERLIDEYVKFQQKSVTTEYIGQATSGTTTTLIDTSPDSQLGISDNFLQYCVVEIIAGTNEGETRGIISSDMSDKSITVNTAFTSAIDSTSIFRVYQLAKFPRYSDVHVIDNVYYKYIPERVRQAVLAQLEFINENGDDYFTGNASQIDSESIDDYSYTLAETSRGLQRLISPKSKTLLSGIRNIKGVII